MTYPTAPAVLSGGATATLDAIEVIAPRFTTIATEPVTGEIRS
jgi:hypothetical protein